MKNNRRKSVAKYRVEYIRIFFGRFFLDFEKQAGGQRIYYIFRLNVSFVEAFD